MKRARNLLVSTGILLALGCGGSPKPAAPSKSAGAAQPEKSNNPVGETQSAVAPTPEQSESEEPDDADEPPTQAAGIIGLLNKDSAHAFAALLPCFETTITIDSTSGSYDAKVTQAVLDGAKDKLSQCAGKSSLNTMSITSSLAMHIETSGAISKIELETSVEPEVKRCLEQELGKLAFGKGSKATEVRGRLAFVHDETGCIKGSLSGSFSADGSGGGFGVRGAGATVPQVTVGSASQVGNLNKEIIRRYIRRKLPQIRYCYEKQLLTDATLAGRVSVQFVIEADGHVSSSSATGLHQDVADCVGKAISSIQFPKPSGGGTVTVTYPFNFQPSAK